MFVEYDNNVAEALSLFADGGHGGMVEKGGFRSGVSSTTAGDEEGGSTTGGSTKGVTCLFELINKTKTRSGSQLLHQWLLRPIRDRRVLLQRQESIGALIHRPHLLQELRETTQHLLRFPDMEKIGKHTVYMFLY
jgi:DNA mismatch repair ATPase MutS